MQVNFNNKIQFIINFLKHPSFILIIISLVIFNFGWVSRNFAICSFSSTTFLIAIMLKFKKIKNLLMILISVSIIFSCIELSLNILWSSIVPEGPRNAILSKDSDTIYQKVDDYGYIGIEGSHKQKKIGPDNEVIYDVIYTFGQDGYRLDVPHNNFQIFIYGDSNLFGNGLNDNETLSYYLNKNHKIKSKNLGMGGYGMHQALFNIQNGKTAIKGINILFTSIGHATRSACKPVYSSGTPRYIINKNNKIELNGYCKNKTKLNNFLQNIYIYKLLDRIFFDKTNLTDTDIEIYLGIIEEIFRLTKKNNSKLIIAYLQTDQDINALKKSSKFSNELIINKFSKLADKAVDITLAKTYEMLPKKYFIHKLDTHATGEANIRRAQILADEINNLNQKIN
jgi:hypothetical protein